MQKITCGAFGSPSLLAWVHVLRRSCARENAGICPHCGGELFEAVGKPPNRKAKNSYRTGKSNGKSGWRALYRLDVVSLAAPVTIYELYRPLHNEFQP